MSAHPSHGNSDVRSGHAKEADVSQASARVAIPSSSSATLDAHVPRSRPGERDEASHATHPPPCAAAPFPTAGVSVPLTPSVGSNLSIPSTSTGQVASPGTATRFTVGCLIQVVDMLRRLNERAKTQTCTFVAGSETRENHGADRAGSPANAGPLGAPASNRGAPGDQDKGQIER